MAIEFEKIIGTTEGGTPDRGLSARKKIERNFEKVNDGLAQIERETSRINGFPSVDLTDFSMPGYINKSTGVHHKSNDFKCSGFIPVFSDTEYFIFTDVENTAISGFATYDANRMFLGTLELKNQAANILTFTSSVKYIRGTVLQFGFIRRIAENSISQIPKSGDVIDINFTIPGYLNKYGEISALSGVYTTDYIDISNVEVLIVRGMQLRENDASFLLYDSAKNVVARLLIDNADEIRTFDVKNFNIKYFRACNFQGSPTVLSGSYVNKIDPTLIFKRIETIQLTGRYARKTDGVFVQDVNFSISDFISINSANTYSLENKALASWIGGHCIYDASFNFIRSLSLQENTTSKIKFNVNEKYILLTSREGYVSSLFVIDNEMLINADEFSTNQVTKNYFFDEGINLLHTTWTEGAYINTFGIPVPLTGYRYSNLIDISDYKKIILNTPIRRTQAASNLWLNKNQIVLGKIQVENNSMDLINVPTGANFIRLSDNDYSTQIFGASISEKKAKSIKGFEINLVNRISPSVTWTENFYFNNTGESIRGNGFAIGIADVSAYKYVEFYSGVDVISPSNNVFFDENMNFLSLIESGFGKKVILERPSTAKYLGMTWHYLTGKPLFFLSNTINMTNSIISNSDATELFMLQQKQVNNFEYGYVAPDYNALKMGAINPSVVVTNALFLDDTGMIPKDGVALVFSQGSLMLVANGIKYLVNLTKLH